MSDNFKATENNSRHELRDLVRSQLQILLDQNNLKGAKSLLIPVQPVDIAEAIASLSESAQVIAFRLLDKNKAIEVYEHLEAKIQGVLIEDFKRQEVIDIVDKMSPDDRARLFDELPATIVSRIITQLSDQERQATNLLLGYQENTAGRIMTPEYIFVKETFTINETFAKIRSLANTSELIYYVYVVNETRQLTGVVSFRDLVIHGRQTIVKDIMTQDIIYVKTDTDQEEVANLIKRYDFFALPVVDRELRIVGVVTVDDVIDILQKEATQDIYALSAIQGEGENYFKTNLFTITKRRVGWLLVLLLTNTVTGGIIGAQEDIIAQYTILAAFMPLLADTGGNIGAQSSTVVIRGISTEEVRELGTAKVIIREALAGLLLGFVLGLVTMIWAYLLPSNDNNLIVAFAVGITLTAICTLASIAGSALPFLFRRLGLDPALMSGPFITTAVDVLGILIYFNIARAMLGF
ncbi:magnesium transporter [Cyanobacterium aponinum]|uniref:Magnesium transporter MgtE n=1 Tax=Cyanobacterium aponinum 0216 TaxID=2676140 RepID=A0A844GSX9_9CHRO|nr:magnesium transporter [Cyanobacterium aponinum 0216]